MYDEEKIEEKQTVGPLAVYSVSTATELSNDEHQIARYNIMQEQEKGTYCQQVLSTGALHGSANK